jgi:Carboxypeptidase regulatory-like domain
VKIRRSILLAGVAVAVVAAGVLSAGSRNGLMGPPLAQAQNVGQRVVSGAVLDTASAPITGATVFLKNLKTKSIRSFTSDAKGRFQFTQVNMSEEYDLWAEKDGKRTGTKTVSSWDARKEFECELKMK